MTRIILSVILLIWVLLASGRTIINVISLPIDFLRFTQDKQLYTSTFGDDYTFATSLYAVEANDVVLTEENGRRYFLTRYLLYPKRIYLKSEQRHPENSFVMYD